MAKFIVSVKCDDKPYQYVTSEGDNKLTYNIEEANVYTYVKSAEIVCSMWEMGAVPSFKDNCSNYSIRIDPV